MLAALAHFSLAAKVVWDHTAWHAYLSSMPTLSPHLFNPHAHVPPGLQLPPGSTPHGKTDNSRAASLQGSGPGCWTLILNFLGP